MTTCRDAGRAPTQCVLRVDRRRVRPDHSRIAGNVRRGGAATIHAWLGGTGSERCRDRKRRPEDKRARGRRTRSAAAAPSRPRATAVPCCGTRPSPAVQSQAPTPPRNSARAVTAQAATVAPASTRVRRRRRGPRRHGARRHHTIMQPCVRRELRDCGHVPSNSSSGRSHCSARAAAGALCSPQPLCIPQRTNAAANHRCTEKVL